MAPDISKISLKNILLSALLIRLLLVIFSGFHPDLLNHLDWGNRFLDLGPKKFYENIFWGVSWPNQPLGSILLFAFCAFIKKNIFSSILFLNQSFTFFPSFIIPFLEKNLHIWLVKLPFILADIGLGFLIYRIVINFKPKFATLAASFFLFNPAIIYNSTIWGQTDSLINLLALSGLYLVFKRHYFSGVILFLSTFLFKLSLIIYLPVLGLIFLKRIKDWKHFLLPLISFSLFAYLLAIPFTFGHHHPFQWLWYMYTNRVLVRQGSMLNGNAFNLWALIFSIDLSKSEFGQFSGLSYQFIGRLLYLIFLIPIWVKFFNRKLNLTNIFNVLILSAFGSFIFLTNMHERYLYPIIPVIATLIYLPKTFFKIKDLIILSVIHFLNLYNLWFYPTIPFLKNLLITFNFSFCRLLSLILIIICGRYLIKYLHCES